MAKKMRMVRTFARTASKSMEKRLVENAKKLMDDPYQILPTYSDPISKKHIGKIRKNFEKVYRYVHDTKKLEKISNKRGLDGALAGTLLIGHAGKAPYLGVAKFSSGEVTYAQRGRADKEKLIAIQHFDNPILRLLALKDMALKKDLHIYSWDEGYISTGRIGKPPDKFINFVFKKMKLPIKNKMVTCPHLHTNDLKNKKALAKPYLRINWKSPDILIGVCENCSQNKKNMIIEITKYLIETDISNDFEIEVIGELIKGKDNDNLIETQYKEEYYSGKINDYEIIRKNMTKRKENLKVSGEKVFILDGTAYKNTDDFIINLKPKYFEKKPLKFILDRVDEPIILENVTSNKVLEMFWIKHGLDAINSIIDDKKLSKDFFSLSESPSDILELTWTYKERQKILSKLPKYRKLPPLADFTDRISRTHMMFGEKKALSELNKIPDSTKAKSIAYAFLIYYKKAKDKKWKYSKIEIEYGEFLTKFVKKLLESKPNQYHENLKELILACGSNEELDKYLIKI